MASRKARMKRRRKGTMYVPPGTVQVDPAAPKPTVRLIQYDLEHLDEYEVTSVPELAGPIASDRVAWVHVDGVGDQTTIEQIRDVFLLHRLAIEDVVNLHQRPKAEDYERHLYVVLQMPRREPDCLRFEQLSLFLGPSWVLTFEEAPPDVFDPIRERLRRKLGLVRGEKADYLLYVLIDCVIDAYFPVLEQSCDRIEALEQEVLHRHRADHMDRIHELKQELLAIRRAIFPLRDLLLQLLRNERGRFGPTALVHLRDCCDHVAQLMDLLEVYRDLANDLMHLHLANLNIRQNEIMKVLTVVSAIFIPLSFIAGIYGMNFDPEASPWNMPELSWEWGYPMALGMMFLTASGMLIFFKLKGWLGRE